MDCLKQASCRIIGLSKIHGLVGPEHASKLQPREESLQAAWEYLGTLCPTPSGSVRMSTPPSSWGCKIARAVPRIESSRQLCSCVRTTKTAKRCDGFWLCIIMPSFVWHILVIRPPKCPAGAKQMSLSWFGCMFWWCLMSYNSIMLVLSRPDHSGNSILMEYMSVADDRLLGRRLPSKYHSLVVFETASALLSSYHSLAHHGMRRHPCSHESLFPNWSQHYQRHPSVVTMKLVLHHQTDKETTGMTCGSNHSIKWLSRSGSGNTVPPVGLVRDFLQCSRSASWSFWLTWLALFVS